MGQISISAGIDKGLGPKFIGALVVYTVDRLNRAVRTGLSRDHPAVQQYL